MKYKSLAELVVAIRAGELKLDNRDHLLLDNDFSCFQVHDSNDPDDEGETVFEGKGPYHLVREALPLLGVPFRNP